MVWSVLLVLGVSKEWQESSGWRCSDHMSWLQGCLWLTTLFCLLLASCGDVNIKQTPGLRVTVLALIEGLPDSAYLNYPGQDLPSVWSPSGRSN